MTEEIALASKLPLDEPQDIYNIIDRAILLTIDNWMIILKTSLWPAIACFIAQVLMQYSLHNLINSNFRVNNIIIFSVVIFISFLVYFCAYWVWFIRQLAVAKYLSGFADSIEDSLKFINKTQWDILLYNFALAILIIIVLIPIFIEFAYLANFLKTVNHPAIIATFLLSVFLVFTAFIFTSLSAMIAGSIVIMCENTRLRQTIKKIYLFIKTQLLNIILIHLFLVIILLPLSIAFYIPSLIVSSFDIGNIHKVNQIHELIKHQNLFTISINKVCEIALQFFSYSLINITYGLLYLNFKMKYLGLDILNKIKGRYEEIVS